MIPSPRGSDDLRTGRALAAIAAIGYPLFWFSARASSTPIRDPGSVRLLVACALAGLFAGSFLSATARRHLPTLLLASVYAVTVHVHFLLYDNALDPRVVLASCLVLVGFLAAAMYAVASVQSTLVYLFFTMTLTGVVAFTVERPRTPPGFLMVVTSALAALAFVAVRGHLITVDRFRRSEQSLRRDVERRREAETALHRSEARATALLDALPDVLLRLGRGGAVVDVRATTDGPLARTLRAASGAALDTVLESPGPCSIAEAVDAVRNSGGVATVSSEAPSDAGRRSIELRIARAGDDECLAVARDLTQEREMEARLRVQDRLASLGTLATGVAHEINNPLAYVNANVDFVLTSLANAPTEALRSVGGPEIVQALEEARDGGRRIAHIVASLKRQARQEDEPVSAIDARGALDVALRMLDSQIRYRSRLELKADDVPKVMANSQRLVQVLVNLLTNAIHALPARPTDENLIRAAVTQSDAEHVTLSVEDNGTGMPESVRERIFDPFFTTKAPGVGTGLGLYLCHQFVVSFGGKIEVSTAPGVGTTFRVILKVAPEASDEAPLAETSSLPRSRILVVDDEPLVGRAIARALRNHDVLVATDARKALSECRAGQFDLVLCDVMMPNMDGSAFYAELCVERPDLASRVVFMTGGAFTPETRHFLDTVPNPKMQKPIEAKALLEIAKRQILRAQSGRPAERVEGRTSRPPRFDLA
jgi:signal transduction histidine kinase